MGKILFNPFEEVNLFNFSTELPTKFYGRVLGYNSEGVIGAKEYILGGWRVRSGVVVPIGKIIYTLFSSF